MIATQRETNFTMDLKDLKIFACESIQDTGIVLKLAQTAATTAQILLHRVYGRQEYSIEENPLDVTSMAALFLASKIEECPRKADDLIDAFVYVLSSKLRRNFKLDSESHDKIRQELITTERRLLKNLGFNLLSSYPHKSIVSYYFLIVNHLDSDHNVWRERDNQNILQLAWNYCNDSLRSDVFIKFSKEAVACACIQMACEDSRMVFPRSTDGREWYLLFTNESELKTVIDIIRDLYKYQMPNYNDVRQYLYLAKI